MLTPVLATRETPLLLGVGIFGFPLTPTPSPRKEGKGKTRLLSPSLFTGEGFGVGDISIKSKYLPLAGLPLPMKWREGTR